jgi:hypothetical protein
MAVLGEMSMGGQLWGTRERKLQAKWVRVDNATKPHTRESAEELIAHEGFVVVGFRVWCGLGVGERKKKLTGVQIPYFPAQNPATHPLIHPHHPQPKLQLNFEAIRMSLERARGWMTCWDTVRSKVTTVRE